MIWMLCGRHTRLCLDKQDLSFSMNALEIKCHHENIHYKSNIVRAACVNPPVDHSAHC